MTQDLVKLIETEDRFEVHGSSDETIRKNMTALLVYGAITKEIGTRRFFLDESINPPELYVRFENLGSFVPKTIRLGMVEDVGQARAWINKANKNYQNITPSTTS